MIDKTVPIHPIQHHIISVLMQTDAARFSDMRPDDVDTNLYSYHLKKLLESTLVVKNERQYMLSALGLRYGDRLTHAQHVLEQSHAQIMFVVQNSDGDILLQQRQTQPFIHEWTLPTTPLIADEPLEVTAQGAASRLLGIRESVQHAGVCHVRVSQADNFIYSALIHVFRAYQDDIETSEQLRWARPHKLAALQLAPAVQEIMTRTFFRDPFFFEEFDVKRG